MRKIMLCLCLLCIGTIARGQTSYEYVYWLDNDMASGRMSVTSGDSWQTGVDVACLSDGLHSLHIQVRNTDSVDVWSAPVTRYFIKQTSHSEEMTYRYWFDNDNATMVVSNEELAWLDVSALDDGLHMLHVMAEGTVATQTLSCQFLKIPQTDGVDYLHCLCYLDGKLYHQERVASSGGIVHWEFDVSGLAQGIHNIQVQTVTPSGAATGLYESMFLRTTTHAEMASLKCFYTIDGAESYIEAGTYADGAFHFDLDVSTIDDGLHQLAYMLVGDNGVSTKVSSAFFMKTPLGGNGITQYWYWLNDDDANKTVVKLEECTNPFQLIGLLPVESVPIRSSLFHFEVDEEQGPMVYAKNEFHIRFYDATGRLVDATKEFVDLEVKEKVTEVSPLLQIQTLTKPGENEIRWYKFVAQVGDSVAFKTNKACSINVFAADGTEIYAASGSGSVNYGGSVIAEDGTYYVALHDVTATAGTDITLDFFHIGKYVVLEYSPEKVGVTPSVLCMELFGNGYQHLQKVELQKGSTLLTPDSIAVIERTKAQLLFVLENGDYERGAYTLRLYFDDGEDSDVLALEDAIAFEDPVWGDIEITFTDKRALALPYPVSINVTNTGNVAYSLVPLNFAYNNADKINDVEFLNFSINAYEELIKMDILPIYQTDNLFGKGEKGVVFNTLIPHLLPGETKSVTLGFHANGHTIFTLNAWTGIPWSMMTSDATTARGSYSRSLRTANSTDCMPDPCEYMDIFDADGIDCECALTMSSIKALINAYLARVGSGYRNLNDAYGKELDRYGLNRYQEFRLESPLDILMDVLEECLGGFGDLIGLLREADDMRRDADGEPCPDGNSTPVEILTPGDPNDIIGFKSVAGSKYVPSDIEDTHYTIRFENDPEIATTSAHVITVRDTLDGRYLDLSTFSPTSVCIGDRMLELNGEKLFTKTLDMRTHINAIAEVSLDYDEAQGIAVWTIRSLDPMTMEETWDYMQGVLPVNSNGEGEGQISFDIKLREGLADGTKISNRASIVFDNEGTIMTPTWTNTIDDTKPVSEMVSIVEVNDTVIQLNWQGSDNATELWKYTLAVQVGENGVWSEILTDTLATSCMLRYYRDTDYGFCVLATDSAGNVESREWVRKAEFMREYIAGDADRSGTVNLLDLNLTLSHILGNEVGGCDMLQMDANGDGSINVLDINAILQIILDADGEGAAQRKRDSGVIRIINTKVI